MIYQRVSIRNGSTRLKRDLYRDAKAIRHRRIEPVSVEAHAIQQAFSGTGIDWDDPLSARSYRTWHDQQHRVSDEVKKDDDRHLTLVTTLESGPVSQESLTVRLPDFHPIQRTIETRDNGTIEIAELSYAVLDWSAVNQALFEPLHGVEPSLPIHIRAPLSDEQLDVAELAARLSLNHLHADEGEQINVVRGNQGVLVKGIVETDERKRALIAQLHLIPHVNTNILSIPELESAPLHSTATPSITAESLSASVSPLQAFLSGKGQQGALGGSSTKLLDAALAIHRNAVLIDDLRSRFGSSSAQADTAYKSLLSNYTDRLNSAVNTQVATLNQLGFVPPASPVPRTQPASLEPDAERVESLCRELISGDAAKQRSAPEIASDLYQALFNIRSSTPSAQLPK